MISRKLYWGWEAWMRMINICIQFLSKKFEVEVLSMSITPTMSQLERKYVKN